MVTQFPPIETADESGLLYAGGDLEVATLKRAYLSGIFPWPLREGMPILWFAPPLRAILRFRDLHVPERLRRQLKKDPFEFRIDHNFRDVIEECALSTNRKNQRGTWITREVIQAYTHFHRSGFAHSFEAYNRKGKLVGGMYGVLIKKMFAGESMFYKEANASKFVLLQTANYLKSMGLSWIDVQVLTPLLKSFGAQYVSRAYFMKMLEVVVR